MKKPLLLFIAVLAFACTVKPGHVQAETVELELSLSLFDTVAVITVPAEAGNACPLQEVTTLGTWETFAARSVDGDGALQFNRDVDPAGTVFYQARIP